MKRLLGYTLIELVSVLAIMMVAMYMIVPHSKKKPTILLEDAYSHCREWLLLAESYAFMDSQATIGLWIDGHDTSSRDYLRTCYIIKKIGHRCEKLYGSYTLPEGIYFDIRQLAVMDCSLGDASENLHGYYVELESDSGSSRSIKLTINAL